MHWLEMLLVIRCVTTPRKYFPVFHYGNRVVIPCDYRIVERGHQFELVSAEIYTLESQGLLDLGTLAQLTILGLTDSSQFCLLGLQVLDQSQIHEVSGVHCLASPNSQSKQLHLTFFRFCVDLLHFFFYFLHNWFFLFLYFLC